VETKEERLKRLGEGDLQQWQKDILAMEDSKESSSIYLYGMERDNEIVLTQSQANMLEKVLGNDFYIQDEKVREVLEAVLELGFYYERDRKILNIARDCYLKGKNWIKRSYR